MKSLSINGKSFSIEAQDEMPLLWAIRDIIGLTGTPMQNDYIELFHLVDL